MVSAITTMYLRIPIVSMLVIVFALCWSGCTVLGERWAAQKCKEYQNIKVDNPVVIPLVVRPHQIKIESFTCSKVVQLISGGEQAKYGEFPHHALLGFQKQGGKSWEYNFLCGGTLISDQHILTAAHCFNEIYPAIVRLGEYNIEQNSPEEYDAEIDSFRQHENYSTLLPYHDIALIKLKKRVNFSRHIRPACLWETEERNTTRYIATGFGYNETFGGKLSTVMMKVQLNEFHVGECVRKMRGDRKFKQGIKKGQLCVGSSVEGRDTCRGDSGGPLQVVTNAKTCTYSVVGVTSTGVACGIGMAKAIYTKVSHYIDWIEDNVWGPNAM